MYHFLTFNFQFSTFNFQLLMGIPKLAHYYTFQEYLAIDESSELRNEYHDGSIIAMAGSSKNHNIISGNTFSDLLIKLRGKGKKCTPFISDIRVQILSKNHYYYPDVVVSCDEADAKNQKWVSSPTLVVEVLSDSTATKDMSTKLLSYFQLPSLEYYMLIAQDAVTIHLYEKTAAGWEVKLFTDKANEILLPKMDISLFVKDLYEEVSWEENL